MVVLVIAADVGIEEPLHPTTQVAVSMRPEHQMEVVGQYAIGQHAHGDGLVGIAHGLEEGLEVAVFVKDLVAGVAPVEDMVANIANRGASRARHAQRLPGGQAIGKQKKMNVPFR
jgi:hypothetical protein